MLPTPNQLVPTKMFGFETREMNAMGGTSDLEGVAPGRGCGQHVLVAWVGA
jgi:hypothetical protein